MGWAAAIYNILLIFFIALHLAVGGVVRRHSIHIIVSSSRFISPRLNLILSPTDVVPGRNLRWHLPQPEL